MQPRVRLSCSDGLICTGRHTLSPLFLHLTSTSSCRGTSVRSPRKIFFEKSSSQILPSGPLREASPPGFATRWDNFYFICIYVTYLALYSYMRHISLCIHTCHIFHSQVKYVTCMYHQVKWDMHKDTYEYNVGCVWIYHIFNLIFIHVPLYIHKYIFIGKVVFICLVGSVNPVLKFLGQPGETRFQPGGDEISSGVPMTFNTKLTEPKGK